MSTPPIEYTGQKLSRDDIWLRYPDQWVVLVDLDVQEATVRSGALYARSTDRASLRPLVKALREAAVFWTGPRMSPTLALLAHVAR